MYLTYRLFSYDKNHLVDSKNHEESESSNKIRKEAQDKFLQALIRWQVYEKKLKLFIFDIKYDLRAKIESRSNSFHKLALSRYNTN